MKVPGFLNILAAVIIGRIISCDREFQPLKSQKCRKAPSIYQRYFKGPKKSIDGVDFSGDDGDYDRKKNKKGDNVGVNVFIPSSNYKNINCIMIIVDMKYAIIRKIQQKKILDKTISLTKRHFNILWYNNVPTYVVLYFKWTGL